MSKTKKFKLYKPYTVLIIINMFFILYALVLNDPSEIFNGIITIIKSNDLLITDYIELTNFGAALFNVALVGLSCVLIVIFSGVKPSGGIIMGCWMAMGFSFFGKNIYNIWPPMIGVFIFSKFKRSPFSSYSLVCILSTSLAPIVTQTSFWGLNNIYLEVFIGFLAGIFAGFLLPPISAACVKIHSGYDLYNVGFAAGVVGTLFVSITKSFGIETEKNYIWGTTYNFKATIFIISVSAILIFFGLYKNAKENLRKLREIFSHSGRLVTDYYFLYNESSYINMGILGIYSCIILLLIKGNLNGPTLGAIFTIIGFGAFGKHILNTTPVLAGAIFSTFINVWNAPPSNALSILFSTCLAPIAGQFGWIFGFLAGFLHIAVVSNVVQLHAGLNLYNNGFAGGFVALILVPIITEFRKEKKNE